jgi:hypothetical protein
MRNVHILGILRIIANGKINQNSIILARNEIYLINHDFCNSRRTLTFRSENFHVSSRAIFIDRRDRSSNFSYIHFLPGRDNEAITLYGSVALTWKSVIKTIRLVM